MDTIDDSRVMQQERLRIAGRREKAGLPPGDPEHDCVALSLSGGGIRSATFNLGLLQALEGAGQLKHVDYLSTVSGGGYIGSSLTWFMSVLGSSFPFGTKRGHNTGDQGNVVAWLRAHGNYLMPGAGLTVWSLLAAILTGTLATLAVLVPLFLWLVWWLAQPFGAAGWLGVGLDELSVALGQQGFAWITSAGILLLELFLLGAFLFAISTGVSLLKGCHGFLFQRWLSQVGGYLLSVAVALLVLGSIPYLYALITEHLPQWGAWVRSSISLSGVTAILAALFGRKNGSESKGLRAVALGIGLALLVYGLFLWFYHLMHGYSDLPGWLGYALLLSLVVALFANINHVSMHRFYRNRLMEAFMPDSGAALPVGGITTAGKNADNCCLHTIPQTEAPYHIINTNVQLVGSGNTTYRLRAGDNFILSPEYCGGDATGYVKSCDYVGGGMNLATACAISGAAVDPNTYMTRSRPLTFLMTLLNVRLGYWIRNPRHPAMVVPLSRPRWYWYLFRELFGRGLTEECWHVHLSDGGHFENLALYEMVRRNCRAIVVADAGADPDWLFADLARVIELVRTDFGAKIEIDVELLQPDAETGLSEQPFVEGRIHYRNGDIGNLIYIKSSMFKRLPEDVAGYKREYRDFPDQSTGDQFFDEFQFEAYRELGYQIGSRVFASVKLD